MATLHVRVLGGLELEGPLGPLAPIPSRSGRSLFAYLLLNRARPATRDLLAGVFWPEMSEARARRRLSQALWQIQSVLSALSPDVDYLIATPSSVQFNPRASVWLDADVFEERLAAAKSAGGEQSDAGRLLLEAVQLYRGDLLAGFYDDWMLVEQDRFREMYLTALEVLTRLAKARGDFEDALQLARRIALQDPLREEAHREIMRLSLLVGRPNDALQQYERCRSVLMEELGTEPTEATRTLRHTIARWRVTAAPPIASGVLARLYNPAGPSVLVGRVEQRELLISRMEEALGGNGSVVLLEGESGVGKTRLLQEAVGDAHWRGLGVLWGEARQDDNLASYGILADAVSGDLSPLRAEQLQDHVSGVLLAYAARIIPGLADWLPRLAPPAPLRSGEERQVMMESIQRVLAAFGEITPHLVVLDDVHWADDDSLATLPALARSVVGLPIVLCISYRGDEARLRPPVWEALEVIDRTPGRARLMLQALSAPETAELVRSVSRDQPTSEVVRKLHAETGGNPLFVLETLRALYERDIRRAVEEELFGLDDWDEEAFPVSTTVRDVVVRRLLPLVAESRHVLNALAVLDGSADLSMLSAVAAIERVGLLAAVDDLVARGFVLARDGRYRTAHEQIRRVAYDDLAPEERRRLHAIAATTLEHQGSTDHQALARHFLAAADLPKGVPHLAAAGRRAAGLGAYATAGRLYSLAVAEMGASGLDAREQVEVLLSYEEVLDVLGRRKDQAAVLEQAERLADEQTLSVCRLRRVWLLANTDHLEEAQEAAADCVRLARAAGDQQGTSRALIALATARLWSGKPRDAIADLRDAALMSRGSPAEEARARCTLGAVLAGVQDYPAAEDELESALRLFSEAGDRRGRAEALGYLAIARMEQGNGAGARARYKEALVVCREIGYRHGEGVNLVNLANLAYQQGEFKEALDLYDSASKVFDAIDNRRGEAIVLVNSASLRINLLGETDRALDDARRAMAFFEEVRDQRGRALGLQIIATAHEQSLRFDEAEHTLTEALEAVRATGDRRLESELMRNRALLELTRGHPGEAVEWANLAMQVGSDLGLHDSEGVLLGVKARAALELGDLKNAQALAKQARRGLEVGADRAVCVPFWQFEIEAAAGDHDAAWEALAAAQRLVEKRLAGFPAAQIRAAWVTVPEHRDIEDALHSHRPSTVYVRLARVDAPSGRPLRDEDRVEVVWTVATPADDRVGDRLAVRRHRLIRLAREAASQGAVPTVTDLAGALGVSTATVRRDLALLRVSSTPITTRGAHR